MAAGARFFFYFAYGSNLLRERLVLKNPSAQFTAVGKLQGYELVFVGSGERWKGGAANIRQKQDSDVWGVVWRLEEQDLPSLQLQEHGYTQMEVEVKAGDDGRIYPCHTFQLRLPGHWTEEAPPSPHYKDVIVRGARQNHLPCHYLQRLQAVQDNGYEGKVEVYDAVIALLNDTTGVKRE